MIFKVINKNYYTIKTGFKKALWLGVVQWLRGQNEVGGSRPNVHDCPLWVGGSPSNVHVDINQQKMGILFEKIWKIDFKFSHHENFSPMIWQVRINNLFQRISVIISILRSPCII